MALKGKKGEFRANRYTILLVLTNENLMNRGVMSRLYWPCQVLVLVMAIGIFGEADAQPIRKSNSGICHCPGGQYYERTSRRIVFDSIEACLASGGRHPKRGQGQCSAPQNRDSAAGKTQGLDPTAKLSARPYDRNMFGGWADADRDCQNTRHERLIDLSSIPVRLSENGCWVIQGHWEDPYTGTTHTLPEKLHIDHLVPLYYAWQRGADRWEPEELRRFMNDPANLLAVEAVVNQDKGAKGPLAWLPPDARFHCEYLLRFMRITARYNLHHSPREQAGLEQLTADKCD